ncbi:TIR domain-containing protein [Tindallia magadiensis]|nr:nucleotide-binding protein [Tindallia magadiensis]
MPEGLIMFVSESDIVRDDSYELKVITKEVFKLAEDKIAMDLNTSEGESDIVLDFDKVFIVHGRDDLAKTEAARLVERLGLTPIILHEQASANMTIIEKIESYSNVGFALVLYTPCDVGVLDDGNNNFKSRARQNVVFEHGFLMGKLGRKRVCALVKENIETPNDISGIIYVEMDNAHAWEFTIAKEMRHLGYPIDLNRL